MEVFEWKIWRKWQVSKAAEFVKDGMVVGLGTGSTAYYFVEEIGRRIKEEGLHITAVRLLVWLVNRLKVLISRSSLLTK